MAKNLDTFPEQLPTGAGRPPRHPWNDWLNGQIWELELGTDFQGTPKTFAHNARNVARGRGKLLRVQCREDGVILQARPRNHQET